MKNLRMLTVSFIEPIRWEELECFRGAMVEKVGIQHDYYHNHNNKEGAPTAYHYRYPLIQYHLKQGRPQLLFLEDAIDEARHFFAQPDWQLQLNGRAYNSTIEELKAKQFPVKVSADQEWEYRLHNWQALNMKNYEAYQAKPNLTERIAMLQRVLVSQILAFSTGVDYRLPIRLELELTDWHSTRKIRYKGVLVKTFDLSFRANILLPNNIGLGKGASLGFGRCWSIETDRKTQNAPTETAI